MNIRMLVYILGKVLLIEGALMLLPVVCGLFYGEVQVFYYIGLAAIYIGAGFLISDWLHWLMLHGKASLHPCLRMYPFRSHKGDPFFHGRNV